MSEYKKYNKELDKYVGMSETCWQCRVMSVTNTCRTRMHEARRGVCASQERASGVHVIIEGYMII